MTIDPSGIEQMIIDVGAPRNHAEELLIAKMRQYAATEKRLGSLQAHVEWTKALITVNAIITYRAHGETPVRQP